MPEQISNHRMGAYVYGFLSGVGLIMIIWGLASIASLPSTNLLMNVGLVLFGVTLLAVGSCREAYLQGNLSTIPAADINTKHSRSPQPSIASPVSEQIIRSPEEIISQKSHES